MNTAFMRDEGLAQVSIPKLSSNDTTTTYKFREEGGDGIEIYTGIDGFTIPLKIAFRIPIDKKNKIALIELYIIDYASNTDKMSVPKQYRRLLNKDLLVMNI